MFDIVLITSDGSLSESTKLIMGKLLFEETEPETLKNLTKEYLEIFNSKSKKFKQLGWQKLHLLNSVE